MINGGRGGGGYWGVRCTFILPSVDKAAGARVL